MKYHMKSILKQKNILEKLNKRGRIIDKLVFIIVYNYGLNLKNVLKFQDDKEKNP